MKLIPVPILNAIDELDRLAPTRSDAMQIPRGEGEVLFQIALATRAKRIVEIGTSYGFSGLWWGAAMLQTGGRVDTIDILQKKFDSAKATFEQVGLVHVITNHLGSAKEIVAQLTGVIDIAFIDADKDATMAYFELLWPKISRGGSIIVDNALTHKDELAPYTRYVRSLAGATSTIVPVGNGFEWTIKNQS